MANVILRIEHDNDCMSPEDCDNQWKLYSFSTRHSNFVHPDKFSNVGMRRKLHVGTAFQLSYYEHGNSLWMLSDGSIPAGVEFQWDGVRKAGVLVFEHSPKLMGAKTREERAKDAQCFLDEYNAWANGECYSYGICKEGYEDNGDLLDSCCGFIGSDSIKQELSEILKDHTVIKVIGNASYIWN